MTFISSPSPQSTGTGPSLTSPQDPSTSVSSTTTNQVTSFGPTRSTTNTHGATSVLTTFTTSFPIIISQSSSTLTSFSQTVVTTAVLLSTTASASAATPNTPSSSTITSPASQSARVNAKTDPVCIGDGIDAYASGLIAALVLPSAIGLIIWLIFAIVRPKFRQVYALREWFVQQDLRPQPLGSRLWAFLFPHVPLVPSVPKDVSNAGRSPVEDAELFPSDEQLSQRALWKCFLIVLGWSFLGLAGALPLYLVSTPCLARSASPAVYGGAYSTLQDLSLLRLLQLYDSGNITTSPSSHLSSREIINGKNADSNVRIRIIVLTVLTIALALLPMLRTVIKEFNRMVAYRKRWVNVKCAGLEMGWLSARKAPGFQGWGEKRFKDFIIKTGLSSSLETNGTKQGNRNGERNERRRGESPLSSGEEANLEVDIQSLFSIGDTHQLALLIDERDEILENLEIAETRYISSFRLSTPDPSIISYQPPPPEDPRRPYISRPRALASANRRRRRAYNPAYAASSFAPTSFVAPSQYYKLRGVDVSGGRFTEHEEQPTFSDSIHTRVIGSRFQEVNRDSEAFGRLPIGSHVQVEKSGDLGPTDSSFNAFSMDQGYFAHMLGPSSEAYYGEYTPELGEEWVDLTHQPARVRESDYNGTPPPSARRRPMKEKEAMGTEMEMEPEMMSVGRRETFPLRSEGEVRDVPPPHLRLQPQQPFVRPLSGVNHQDLGAVYGDISHWRTKLKVINVEIADAQRESYNDIADGARIKGWLVVGRGLRFIPGMQMIEGRAKEDVRWDVLQNERTRLDSLVLWALVGVVVALLVAGLTAVAGLALGTAPNVTHYLSFLQGLSNHNDLPSGLATLFAPAVAAVVFIFLALAIISWASNIRGSVSVSAGQLLVIKASFFLLTAIAVIWLIAVGAVLFAFHAFSTSNERPLAVANGAIYMSALALTIVVTIAIIFPGLLLLQPFRLWRVIRAERHAVTPRQRFRAVYPGTYDPSYANGACVLSIIFASTFSLIFPLIGPAVVILLFLTLIAHRFLVGYVYARTHSQTGGLLQIWLLRRFGTLLAFQPMLLGLILLSREFWIEGGILCGVAVAVIIFVEFHAHMKMRLPGRSSLSMITKDSLDKFTSMMRVVRRDGPDEESTSLVSPGRATRTRGSFASVLEMMSLTLAVMPSPTPQRGPVPLYTETLDDLTATERAARTHPDAPPHLPPLPFTDHAEEMSGILYAPELIAPPPIIWLPNDFAGVARSEAYDLQKYHSLHATLDVRTKEDVMPRRSGTPRVVPS